MEHSKNSLILRKLVLSDSQNFCKTYESTIEDAKLTDSPFASSFDPNIGFEKFLKSLEKYEKGTELPPNHVPSSYFIGVVGNTIVGRVSLRHRLNDFLLQVGGHIGYYVVPEFRGKGYATQMLTQTLVMAKSLVKEKRILVTCDEDNIASMKVIEKCCGVLEDIYDGEFCKGKPKCRFWISIN